MGKILGAYLSPHPPIIVEEIGRGEEEGAKKTIEGVRKVALDIKEKSPSIIILVTPHGPLFSDAIAISYEETLTGSFGNFGRPDLKFTFHNNKSLVEDIVNRAGKEDIMMAKVDRNFSSRYGVDPHVDHGALVPLYFVNKEYEGYDLVHITYGLLPPAKLYRFGTIIQEAVLASDEKAVFIASGDLSHRLMKSAPAGYSPKGKVFDKKIVELLKNNDFQGIANFDLELAEAAGECGLRSLIVMSGFLDGFRKETQVYSYEGPFGVGYCTAKVSLFERGEEYRLLDEIKRAKKEKIKGIREKEDEHVRLARKSLEHYIKYGEIMDVPKDLSKELLENRSGVFVSLKKDSMLRGCIGTIEPTKENTAMEIIRNAVSAGVEDPRFPQVEEDELDDIVYSVDVLKEPEKIDSIKELDAKKYGVIVSKGIKRGLLLPNLEGIETPEEQVDIALRKAGIRPNEDYSMERFQVERHI